MNVDSLLKRAMALEFLSIEEGVFLFENAPSAELVLVADELRRLKKNNSNKVVSI